MTLNTKGWSYMKQTEEEIYNYLRADGRLKGLTEKQARAAVKCYSKFCAKFKVIAYPIPLV